MGTRGSQTEAEAADKRDGDTKGALGVRDEREEKEKTPCRRVNNNTGG